jgi:hypothetical protein
VDVLQTDDRGRVKFKGAEDLRQSWRRRFDDIFWPALTPPWRKLARANALRVWMTHTFALVKPKTEAGADALCEEIMAGVARYKQLLSQPNAPSMKYPEGWLTGQRWCDDIDDCFLAQHARPQPIPTLSSPLTRARQTQSVTQIAQSKSAAGPEIQHEPDVPEFKVSV